MEKCQMVRTLNWTHLLHCLWPFCYWILQYSFECIVELNMIIELNQFEFNEYSNAFLKSKCAHSFGWSGPLDGLRSGSIHWKTDCHGSMKWNETKCHWIKGKSIKLLLRSSVNDWYRNSINSMTDELCIFVHQRKQHTLHRAPNSLYIQIACSNWVDLISYGVHAKNNDKMGNTHTHLNYARIMWFVSFEFMFIKVIFNLKQKHKEAFPPNGGEREQASKRSSFHFSILYSNSHFILHSQFFPSKRSILICNVYVVCF